MVVLNDCKGTYVNERLAAKHLSLNLGNYDGLTAYQVQNAHKDPGFISSLQSQGCGAIHMGADEGHKARLYVSLCHRYYTMQGKEETISAMERHAKWIQSQANRRLEEHGSFMQERGTSIGRMERDPEIWEAKAKAANTSKPWFGFSAGEFAGGMVDTFKTIGIAAFALIVIVVFLVFVKGKGINAR